MANKEFWGHEGDVLMSKESYEYFEELMRFRNKYDKEWILFHKSK